MKANVEVVVRVRLPVTTAHLNTNPLKAILDDLATRASDEVREKLGGSILSHKISRVEIVEDVEGGGV